MNKLTIFILVVITLGLIASPALAGDRLSNSDFFYGEAIANPLEAVQSAAVNQPADVQRPTITLSASNFFYGDTIPNHIEAVHATHQQDNAAVATLPSQLAPEMFYGYTNANAVATPCCSTCSNC